MKKMVFLIYILINGVIYTQGLKINSVTPAQDVIGVSINTQIIVEVNKAIDSLECNINNLFQIYGSNSGLVNGEIVVDINNKMFVFTLESPFYCGEIVNVFFGPVSYLGDSLKTYIQWRFITEITNQTNANFDSLIRYYYPSGNAIALDFNSDGAIDIISGTGRVIYNDGTGSFIYSEEIEELNGLKYLIDVNNDQILDIISSYENGYNVFLGDSAGNYNSYQNLFSGGVLIAKGDITGDGFVDLILKDTWGWNGQNYLWKKLINDGTGKFIIEPVSIYLENYISEADLVDMDKDGDLDLVLLNTWPSSPGLQYAGSFIYYNDGRGNFGSYVQAPFRINFPPYFDVSLTDLRQLYVADYDLNGLNDIAGFGSAEGGLIILQESGSAFYGYVETIFSGAENFAFFTSGDIDGNGRLDCIISNWQVCPECGDTGEVRMENYLNFDPIDLGSDSSVTCSLLGRRIDVGESVVPIVADVDNDGDLDIIHTGYPTIVTYNRDVLTIIKEQDVLPPSFSLSQNYPNPFNSITKISYNLPAPGIAKITIYDVLGVKVNEIINEYQNCGSHTISFDTSDIASGIYLYKLEYMGKKIVRKMIQIK